MVESAREMCGSVCVGGGNIKNVWWNDQVKAAVKREEDAWKDVLEARDEDVREKFLEVYKEEMRKVKRCIYGIRAHESSQVYDEILIIVFFLSTDT